MKGSMTELHFWIVTKATPVSTINDIAFLTDIPGLMKQARGGLDEDEIVLVTFDAQEANEAARAELDRRIND